MEKRILLKYQDKIDIPNTHGLQKVLIRDYWNGENPPSGWDVISGSELDFNVRRFHSPVNVEITIFSDGTKEIKSL